MTRNILSCERGTIFTGEEINKWCAGQIKNNRGVAREREARRLLRKNYADNELYMKSSASDNSASGAKDIVVFERVRDYV